MIKTYDSDVALDRAVMFYIMQHKGKGNAVERWSLVALLYGEEAAAMPIRNNNNEYDRHMRESIERLRGEKKHICNTGSGYYYAVTREEYKEFKRYYLRSVYRQLKITSAMDEGADERWGKEPREADPLQNTLSLFEAV